MEKDLVAHAIEQANKPLVQALGQVKAQLQALTRMQMRQARSWGEFKKKHPLIAELVHGSARGVAAC